jgi:hypothetical protein
MNYKNSIRLFLYSGGSTNGFLMVNRQWSQKLGPAFLCITDSIDPTESEYLRTFSKNLEGINEKIPAIFFRFFALMRRLPAFHTTGSRNFFHSTGAYTGQAYSTH